MKYIFDNDLHIHSGLSSCSNDAEQTPERILKYALDNGLKTICIADHFWDEAVEGASNWYAPQNYEHISQAKPLPQADGVRFLFGCETELDKHLTLGLSKENYDLFDFIVIPTTHLHMKSLTVFEEDRKDAKSRANVWVKRFEAVLNMDLPFHKVGFAHLTCGLICRESREEYLETLNLISDDDMEHLFTKAAELGAGIELNASDMSFADDEKDTVLRPYRIAKKCGCKFYCGSDAHHPKAFDNAKEIFERAIDLLELTEDDKFIVQ